MANKFRAEVDAPEFGPGYTIRLDMAGLGELETQFGDPSPDRFGVAVLRVQYGLAALSPAHLVAFLKAALRKDGERVAELPEIAGPLESIARKCLDVMALFRYGKDHETWVAENAAKEEKPPAENPTQGTKA